MNYIPRTKRAKVYYEHYLENNLAEQKALLWTQTQPAFVEEQKTKTKYGYGHYVYCLNLTPTVQTILESTEKFPTYIQIALIRKLQSELSNGFLVRRLAVSQDSFEYRQDLILNNQVVDLPIGSVRALIARLHNMRTKHRKTEKVYNRVFKQIRCGSQIIHYNENERTGEQHACLEDIFCCKQKHCTRHLCSAHRYQKRKKMVKRDLKNIRERAAEDNLIPVQLVLKTPWALPSSERRHKTRDKVLKGNGKGMARLLRPTQLEAKDQNLLLDRLKQHLVERNKFFKRKVVKEILLKDSHYKTETAFLTPSEAGHRCFPNPHTHIVSAIAEEDCETVQNELTAIWKKITKQSNAAVLVERLRGPEQTQTTNERSSRTHPLRKSLEGSGYDLSKSQVELDEDLESYYSKEDAVTRDCGLDEPSTVYCSTVVCDRTLAEQLDLTDSGEVKRKQGRALGKRQRNEQVQAPKVRDFFLDYKTEERRVKRSKDRRERNANATQTRKDKAIAALIALGVNVCIDNSTKKRSLRSALKVNSYRANTTNDLRTDTANGQRTGVGRGFRNTGYTEYGKCPKRLGGLELGFEREGVLGPILGPCSRGVDNRSGTEVRHVSRSNTVAQSLMVPLQRLGGEGTVNNRLTTSSHGNSNRVIDSGDSQAHRDQDPRPAFRPEKNNDDFFASDQDVAFVEQNLVHNEVLACQ